LNSVIHVVASGAGRLAEDDARERDDRDLRRAAADVDDEMPARLLDGEAGADRGRHRLLHEVDRLRPRLHRRLAHGPSLHLRGARAHTDDDARPEEAVAGLNARDELLQHRLRDLEVRDDAVAQRSHHLDVGRGTAQHRPGLLPDGDDRMPDPVEGDDGGLGDDDALPTDEQQRVGGAEVDADVVGKHAGR
jgi:hypothetical protein